CSAHLWYLPSFPTRRSSDLGISAAVDQHDRRHCGIAVSMKSHSDFAPFALMHAFYHRNRSFVQRTGAASAKLFGTNGGFCAIVRSEEHTSELQSRFDLVCRL